MNLMNRDEIIIFISALIIFLVLIYVAFNLKINRSSVFPSHDKTLIIKNNSLT